MQHVSILWRNSLHQGSPLEIAWYYWCLVFYLLFHEQKLLTKFYMLGTHLNVYTLCAHRQAACVACEDKTVTVFNMGGKRLLPPLVLGSQISVLECTGPYVMAITTQGYLHVWLVNPMQSCIFLNPWED